MPSSRLALTSSVAYVRYGARSPREAAHRQDCQERKEVHQVLGGYHTEFCVKTGERNLSHKCRASRERKSQPEEKAKRNSFLSKEEKELLLFGIGSRGLVSLENKKILAQFVLFYLTYPQGEMRGLHRLLYYPQQLFSQLIQVHLIL
jgi:hypothetical protein